MWLVFVFLGGDFEAMEPCIMVGDEDDNPRLQSPNSQTIILKNSGDAPEI